MPGPNNCRMERQGGPDHPRGLPIDNRMTFSYFPLHIHSSLMTDDATMPQPRLFRILIVQPPPSSPSAPSWLALYLAGCFSSDVNQITFYDANLDDFPTPPPRIETGGDVSKKPQKTGAFLPSEVWKTMQSQAFYRPEAFIAAARALKKTVSNRRGKTSVSKHLHKRFSRRITGAKAHLVLFAADSAAQLLAAWEMRRQAGLVSAAPPMHIVCGPGVDGFPEAEGGVIGMKDLPGMPGRVPGLDGTAVSAPQALPDLTLFPFFKYAAPHPVLDLKGFSGAWIEKGLHRKDKRPENVQGGLLSEADSKALHQLHPIEAFSFPGLALRLPLTATYPPDIFSDYFEKGVRLILWHPLKDRPKETGKTLFHASGAGIWNHLKIPSPEDASDPLVNFAAANPNLVHSWSPCSPKNIFFSDPFPALPDPYEAIAPMHGTPFWRYLADPVFLLLYLIRYGKKTIERWRVRADGTVYTIGEGIAYHFVPPDALPPGYLDIICKMVEAGGSVDTRWVRYNLERAFLIGYAEEEGVIVGNSSLKHPRQEYIKRLSEATGFDLTGYLERGYTSVRPEYRGLGIGTRLLEGLTARVGKKELFAIIGEDNIATQKMAIRNRTRKVGTFFSEKAKKTVGIWVPEWMLDS